MNNYNIYIYTVHIDQPVFPPSITPSMYVAVKYHNQWHLQGAGFQRFPETSRLIAYWYSTQFIQVRTDCPLAMAQTSVPVCHACDWLPPPPTHTQGGHVDCLQWLMEEGQVPLEVKDAGGETLIHHAAFHGQVRRSRSVSHSLSHVLSCGDFLTGISV